MCIEYECVIEYGSDYTVWLNHTPLTHTCMWSSLHRTEPGAGCLLVADDCDCLIKSVASTFASCYQITVLHSAGLPKQSGKLIRRGDVWIKGAEWPTWPCFISAAQVEGEPTEWEEIHPLFSLHSLRRKKSGTGTACPSGGASFSIWDAVWKRVDYSRNMPSLCFHVFWVMWQGHSRQVSSTLKCLMKATQSERQSSARQWDCLCTTQLAPLRINCIACWPFLWSSKARMWRLAFAVAGMRCVKHGLNANWSWGTSSLLQSAVTKPDCQEGETVPADPVWSRQWLNQPANHTLASVDSFNQALFV